MTESDALVEGFEQNRTRLRAVAYRMLGSLAEAEDAVQEAWLRLRQSDASGVDNLGAWLTTVVARVCLNVLRSRNTRREEPLGVHMQDPVISRIDGTTPEDEALLADSVGLALLVVLDTLAPAERLEQLCDYTAMARIRSEEKQFRPDRAVANAMAEPTATGDTLEVTGGAFRSRGKWYTLSYRCTATPDHMSVVTFRFTIGEEIPESKWASFGLWQ